MQNRFKIALIAIPALTLLVYLALGIWQIRSLGDLRKDVRATVDKTLQLENAIGFGGLIHNFKNALIRPDEPAYAEATRRNAEQARILITDLEALAEKSGLAIRLPETRQMVNEYEQRLDIIRAQRLDAGLSASAVDELVRYDDNPALNEILSFQSEVRNDIVASIEQIEFIILIMGICVGLIAMGGCFIIFLLYEAEQKKVHRERFAAQQKVLDRERQHNADLLRVNTALRQFAGIAAHDLKAPTRQVRTFAELAADHSLGADQRENFLGAIMESADRMKRLVESLLEFAKKGFQNPEQKHFNSAQLVEQIISALPEDLPKDTVIKYGNLPDIYADPALMERVFTNLISNALKYKREGEPAEIVIRSWYETNRVMFSVTDNGRGVDPSHAELIFQPLKRVGMDTADGEGIGLSVVQSIISAHGGKVYLDTSYKDGARFVFSLPLPLETEDTTRLSA